MQAAGVSTNIENQDPDPAPGTRLVEEGIQEAGLRDSGFSVVILSCGELGSRVAEALGSLPEVGRLLLVLAPYRTRERSLTQKIRHVHRMQGIRGLVGAVVGKLRLGASASSASDFPQAPPASDPVECWRVNDFHDPDFLSALREYAPDLGVVAGTYILKESVFGLPRMGSINIHTGKVPEYRGAAPGFWEMYNGETEVGVTIHAVEAAVDSGMVFRQELFRFNPAPDGDPLAYLEEYREDVLLANGVRMVREVVRDLARGTAVGWHQDDSRARTYKSPDYRAIKELRRRVAARRRSARRVRRR